MMTLDNSWQCEWPEMKVLGEWLSLRERGLLAFDKRSYTTKTNFLSQVKVLRRENCIGKLKSCTRGLHTGYTCYSFLTASGRSEYWTRIRTLQPGVFLTRKGEGTRNSARFRNRLSFVCDAPSWVETVSKASDGNSRGRQSQLNVQDLQLVFPPRGGHVESNSIQTSLGISCPSVSFQTESGEEIGRVVGDISVDDLELSSLLRVAICRVLSPCMVRNLSRESF